MRYIFLCLCLYGLTHFCNSKTDRFTLNKIQSSLKPNPLWQTENPSLPAVFNQPFYYLGHGAQNYVFMSENKEYVLKFYRHNRTTHPLKWMKGFLPKFWKEKLEKTLDKRRAKRVKDFCSFKLAYDRLKEETALVWLHLNTDTTNSIPLTLYDKIGIKHQVDLMQMTFILQKRADPFYEKLEEWVERKDWDSAQKALTSLTQLLKARCQVGLFDKDADLKTNFGLIGTQVVQIDVGRFKDDETRKLPQIAKEDLIRITDKLADWLNKKSPELAAHLHQEVYD